MKFKRNHCFGVDLYEINKETKQKAELDNRIVQHRQLCNELYDYEWKEVNLEKLLQIEIILKVDDAIENIQGIC